MNFKNYIKKMILLFALTAIICSCSEPVKEKAVNTEPKPVNNVQLPAQMVQSPDGSLHFESNYHRPKSDKDVKVIVSGNKIDTVK